jgi:hypothetical protein
MSLKHVHIGFIVVATLLTLLVGVDAVSRFRADGSLEWAATAAGAAGAVVALAAYERSFIARCRRAGIR